MLNVEKVILPFTNMSDVDSTNIDSINRGLSKKGEVWLNLTRILEPTEIDYFEAYVATFEDPIFLGFRIKVHDNMIRVAPIPVFPNFIQHLNNAIWKAISYNERLKQLERLEKNLNEFDSDPEMDPDLQDFAHAAGIPIV